MDEQTSGANYDLTLRRWYTINNRGRDQWQRPLSTPKPSRRIGTFTQHCSAHSNGGTQIRCGNNIASITNELEGSLPIFAPRPEWMKQRDDKLKLSTSPVGQTQSLSSSPLSPSAASGGGLPVPRAGHRRAPSAGDVGGSFAQ